MQYLQALFVKRFNFLSDGPNKRTAILFLPKPSNQCCTVIWKKQIGGFFLPLLMAKGQWRDSKVSRLAENTSKESCYKQLKRIFRSCSRGLPNDCSITHHTIWNIWSLWWAWNILVFNTPQTIKDVRGHHFFKPVSETHMAISIINPFMPNFVCTSNTVRVMCKELQQNKTKKPAKRTRNGTEISHHTTRPHQRILKLC